MKSESRVKGYKKGTKDWEAEYNMLHDDGITCKECRHFSYCKSLFSCKEDSERCDWYPNRFKEKEA